MSLVTSRAEHMRWAKERAIEYAERGDVTGAIGSMLSDIRKHPDTEGMAEIAVMTAMGVGSPREAKRWVEGFAE